MLDFFRRKKKEPDPGTLEKAPSGPSSGTIDSPDVQTSELSQQETVVLPDGHVTELSQQESVDLPKVSVDTAPINTVAPDAAVKTEPNQELNQQDQAEAKKPGWFGRLRRRFSGAQETEGQQEDVAPAITDRGECEAPLEAKESEPAIDSAVASDPASGQLDGHDQAAKPLEAKESEALAESAIDSAVASDPASGQLEGQDQAKEEGPGWFGRLKKKFSGDQKEIPATTEDGELAEEAQTLEAQEPEGELEAPKKGWFSRLKQKLSSTREMLAGRLERALSAVRSIDEDVLDELEEILITSDLGVKTTTDILYKIRGQVAKKELNDVSALKVAIRARIAEMVKLPPPEPKEVTPLVLLLVGVNGVGKTTTIAKLTRIFQNQGKKVLLAAGDTFRAAAVEQLTIWAKRLEAPIISQPTGADPSAVVFDALTAAKARGMDVVIIDTAGRLHTKVNLMDELKKIKRVANKALPGAPHETILVLDANTGQNAVSQAKIFYESVGIDSLIVTKLDGTSKGGVIISIINEYKLPVIYIGIGESFEDLRPFDPDSFVDAIMGSTTDEG
jgi:fused signal recognition particle receptor